VSGWWPHRGRQLERLLARVGGLGVHVFESGSDRRCGVGWELEVELGGFASFVGVASCFLALLAVFDFEVLLDASCFTVLLVVFGFEVVLDVFCFLAFGGLGEASVDSRFWGLDFSPKRTCAEAPSPTAC